MKIEREAQKATAPRPVGSGQATKVPTHEGSQLGKPQAANETVGGKVIK
jgi:hypothetical protein